MRRRSTKPALLPYIRPAAHLHHSLPQSTVPCSLTDPTAKASSAELSSQIPWRAVALWEDLRNELVHHLLVTRELTYNGARCPRGLPCRIRSDSLSSLNGHRLHHASRIFRRRIMIYPHSLATAYSTSSCSRRCTSSDTNLHTPLHLRCCLPTASLRTLALRSRKRMSPVPTYNTLFKYFAREPLYTLVFPPMLFRGTSPALESACHMPAHKHAFEIPCWRTIIHSGLSVAASLQHLSVLRKAHVTNLHHASDIAQRTVEHPCSSITAS